MQRHPVMRVENPREVEDLVLLDHQKQMAHEERRLLVGAYDPIDAKLLHDLTLKLLAKRFHHADLLPETHASKEIVTEKGRTLNTPSLVQSSRKWTRPQ